MLALGANKTSTDVAVFEPFKIDMKRFATQWRPVGVQTAAWGPNFASECGDGIWLLSAEMVLPRQIRHLVAPPRHPRQFHSLFVYVYLRIGSRIILTQMLGTFSPVA